VSTEALSALVGIRARKLAYVNGFFSVYCIESAGTTFPFADSRGALEDCARMLWGS
jgi:hypothetical protein